MKIAISQKLVGHERKVIATAIAEVLNDQVRYSGAPTFAYKVGGWFIDKNSILTSPNLQANELEIIKPIFEALKIAGVSAQGNLSIMTSKEEINESTQLNLEKLLKSKESLIRKSLQTEDDIAAYLNEEKFTISFYNATVEVDEVMPYLLFTMKLIEQAKTLKYVSSKEREFINEKYAFRCFLLRLGFIGNEYKKERKVLLKNLSGNTAFKEKIKREIE